MDFFLAKMLAPLVYLLALLGAVFIGIKLGGYINWSWWLVTAPWSAVAITIVITFIALYRREYENFSK